MTVSVSLTDGVSLTGGISLTDSISSAIAVDVFFPALIPEMTQGTVTIVGIFVVVVLMLLSAFFASSEIAIFSLADHRISTLVQDGTPGAATLESMKSEPRKLLVTILVGNNIANIGMSALTTTLLGIYFAPGEAALIATFGITSLVLVFGESAPKSYAVENSESWSLRIARPLRIAQYVMYPLVAVFDVLTQWVNKAMGSEGDFEAAYITRSEVQDIVEAGQRQGVFTDEEHRMLQRLLRFHNRIVKETMVPRVDVVAVDADAELSTAIQTSLETGHSQLPVYEETLDTVVGVVHVRDLLAARDSDEESSLSVLADEPFVVPETKDVDDLLRELREERKRMAIVVNEFGSTAGIVTIEDIVEEIIGEILTETESVPIRWLGDDTALVRGELNVHEVNDALETELPETGEFESISGLILARAGRLVEEGEAVTYDGVRLVAETVENNRILEIRVELTGDDKTTFEGATDDS